MRFVGELKYSELLQLSLTSLSDTENLYFQLMKAANRLANRIYIADFKYTSEPTGNIKEAIQPFYQSLKKLYYCDEVFYWQFCNYQTYDKTFDERLNLYLSEFKNEGATKAQFIQKEQEQLQNLLVFQVDELPNEGLKVEGKPQGVSLNIDVELLYGLNDPLIKKIKHSQESKIDFLKDQETGTHDKDSPQNVRRTNRPKIFKDFFTDEVGVDVIDKIYKRFANSSARELAALIYFLEASNKTKIVTGSRKGYNRTDFSKLLTGKDVLFRKYIRKDELLISEKDPTYLVIKLFLTELNMLADS